MQLRFALLTFFALSTAASARAEENPFEITLEIPAVASEPYHRPYVAIWLENADRKSVATIAVWRQKDTWLKDLRQWWRKAGRNALDGVDGVTGATRKPGSYSLKWEPVDANGKKLAPGPYILNFEAVREEGGRDHVKLDITLGKAQSFTLPATKELGPITIKVPAI